MISGCTSMPRRLARTAASKIARPCISVISGYTMPRRHPRRPSIGFVSRSDSTMRLSSSRDRPSVRARRFVSSPPCGRNSCSGGSSRRIVTGQPSIASKIPSKSPRCIGRSFASARRRPPSSRATIISRMPVMRSPSKNMCSVRQSPIPSAPKFRATRASLRRIGIRAYLERARFVGPRQQSRIRDVHARVRSAHLPRQVTRTTSLGIVGRSPENTRPVAPSSVIHSPSLIVVPFTLKLRCCEIDLHLLAADDRRTCPSRARRRRRGSSSRRVR